jgi:hypothetical protein
MCFLIPFLLRERGTAAQQTSTLSLLGAPMIPCESKHVGVDRAKVY